MRCRFVQPEIVRLPLSDGDYVDVKKELTAGEQRRMFAGMMRDMTLGEKVTLNPELVGRTKVSAYVIVWSFVDAELKPVPVSDSAIDNLDTETYAELVKAIDAHEAAMEAVKEKNGTSGRAKSEATSPSAK